MTPGAARDLPILRPTARVLLLDANDRVLLFTASTPDEDTGLPFWFPPGGGLEEGETYEDAAIRELMEETGLAVPLGPELWERDWVGTLAGQWYRVFERYYLARCDDPEAMTRDSWTELELQTITECRWWPPAEIYAAARAGTAVFVPRELPGLLPDVLAGRLPAQRIAVDVGLQ